MKCVSKNPDCFNCPYTDCEVDKATLSKQLAYERRLEKEARYNEIGQRYKNGMSERDLGIQYGMTTQGISRLLKRKGFKEEVNDI